MPCRSDYPEVDYVRDSMQRKLDVATRSACAVFRVMIATEGEDVVWKLVGDEAWKWWKDHEEWDRRRISEARARIEAINEELAPYMKLTPKERKAMGVANRYRSLRRERQRKVADIGDANADQP